MRLSLIALLTVAPAFCVAPALASTCGQGPAAQPLPVRSTLVPPLIRGLAGRPSAVAAPHPLLLSSRDESLALDLVLLRLRMQECVQDAYAGYQPRTQYDNTPWRYNMEKGAKFTAAEFDAWMRSRGVRVAKGRQPAAAGASPPVAAEVTERAVAE